jgi:hypothetical protein
VATLKSPLNVYYTRPADRQGRSASATAQLKAIHEATAARGGHRGTAESAGDYDRAVASGTRGPGSGQQR